MVERTAGPFHGCVELGRPDHQHHQLGPDCNAAYTTTVGSKALPANVEMRVVIVWDTDPNYGSYGTRPSADLDLVIKDPAGNYVTSSSSFDKQPQDSLTQRTRARAGDAPPNAEIQPEQRGAKQSAPPP